MLAQLNPPRKAKRPLPQQFVEDEEDFDSEPEPEPETESEVVREHSDKLSNNRRNKRPASSKSARELVRRQNHSKIEKRRRTKINDTLAELRVLVPSNFGDKDNGQEKDKEGGDKEFKLEVLEKTVAFLKHLIRRVDELEAGSSTSQLQNHIPPTPVSPPKPLPSISSWLDTRLSNHQLPSPPRSSTLLVNHTSYDDLVPPKFTLPSPPSSKRTVDVADTDAASVLVSFSASSRKLAPVSSPNKSYGSSETQPLTPSSILGLLC